MFERLAGKVLNRLLSKYFIQHNDNDSTKGRKSSVWSGYISFQNLELRKEVVNEILQSKGIALELVSGSIRSLELTIPWAQLGLSSSGSGSNGDDGAVVVVVLDGVHVLLRTKYEYDDEALRKEAIVSRRRTLAGLEEFGKATSYSQMLHKRITEGILKDVMEKLHVHIRDVHVRMEDAGFACGVTLESLHVQAEDEAYMEDGAGVIRKEGQLNHLAVYWNAIDRYDTELPVELSILHEQNLSPLNLAKALNKCIARRGSDLASPQRVGGTTAPKHSYLLSPVDATCHVALSTEPDNLIARPRLVASIQIDDLSFHLRDFQVAGIRRLSSSMKEHAFFKQYRPYRPQGGVVKGNARAWWRYAGRVVRMELRESRMRWSWGRFHQRLGLRRRYCHLYERQCRYPTSRTMRMSTSSGALQSLSVVEPDDDERLVIQSVTTPDEGAGPDSEAPPSQLVVAVNLATTLTQEEQDELMEMEDGVRGDLSIFDIILYRALVSARLAGMTGMSSDPGGSSIAKRSGFRLWVSSAVIDDVESEREYDRLISYLDSASKPTDLSVDETTKCLVAVSVRVQLEKGCISLYSPLPSTTDQKELRRLHERFMDIKIKSFFTELDVMGDIEAYQLTVTLEDFSTTELRSNRREYVILSRMYDVEQEESSIDDFDLGGVSDNPLIYVQMTSDPPDHPEYDIGFHANLDAVEIIITPDCEWIHRIRDMLPSKEEKTPSTASFWQNVSLSQLGTLGSDRASWLARTARSIGDHKNLDLDIRINCPVLQFCDTADCTLKVDLGKAHLITESLAGVAIGKLNYAYKDVNQQSQPRDSRSVASRSRQVSSNGRSNQVTSITELTADGSIDGSNSQAMTPSFESRSVATFPASPKMDSFFLSSSASFGGGSEARGFTGRSLSGRSLSGRSTSSGFHNMPRGDSRSVHSSFYDKFQLRLSETRIYLLHQKCEENLLSDIDIAVSLEASVIPADSSLVRFKARAAVNDIVVSVTKSTVAEIGGIAQAWKQSMENAKQRKTSPVYFTPGVDTFNLREELMNEINKVKALEEDKSDSSSVVDENEFLDAFEGDEEAEWAEENWVVDAESVINSSDVKSVKSTVRKRRRRRSISDVSSISDGSNKDGSHKRPQEKHSAAYLSAENLARLEEGGGEEDDSEIESDDDSFHSAISFGGRLELANTLVEDIATAEKEIALLKEKMKELTRVSEIQKNTLHPNATKRRRQQRQNLKVAIDRGQAELRALKASHHDLEQQNEIDVEGEQIEGYIDVSKSFHHEDAGKGKDDVAARRAQSILRYRRNRSSSIMTEGEEQETTADIINQELFQGSFVVKSFCVKLRNDTCTDGLSSLNFQLSQLAFAVSHRARDSKIFFGTDFLTVSMANSGKVHELLRGGSPSRSDAVSRVGSPHVDRFLSVAFDFRKVGKSGITSKGRVFFGGIEVNSEASLVPAVTKMSKEIGQPAKKDKSKGEPSNPLSKLADAMKQRTHVQPTFHDFSIRCSSLRICLLVDDGSPIGAVVITDAGLRTSVELSSQTARVQCDIMCGNTQLYDYGEGSNFAQKELLGRRDHFGNALRGRFRIQCTPHSKLDGWTAGHGRGTLLETGPTSEDIVVDIHCGLRVQPLQFIPFKQSLERFLRLKTTVAAIEEATEKTAETTEVGLPTPNHMAVRWRVDVAVQKISVIVPSGTSERIDVTKIPDSALQLMLSFRACAEHRKSDSESSLPVIRAAFHDVSVVRSLDDWPILERAALSITAAVNHPALHFGTGTMLKRMDVPSDSYWSETNVVLRECLPVDEAAHGAAQRADVPLLDLSLSLSPVRLNTSSSIVALLIRTLGSYQLETGPNQVEAPPSRKQVQRNNRKLHAAFSATHFEIKCFKDVGNSSRGGIAYARPLFSISSVGLLVDLSGNREQFKASLTIADFVVHDLSAQPGIRAVGVSNSKDGSDPSSFLTLSVELQTYESVPVLDVRLRWGKIQALLLPSLIDSLLSVVKDIRKLDSTKAKRPPKAVAQTTPWQPSNMLVNLSFDTDGFECIISSKNIFEHVRKSSGEPINVVSLRWTSSLQGTLALVQLSSGVVPASIDNSELEDQIKVFKTLGHFAENQLSTMVLLRAEDENTALGENVERTVGSIHLNLHVTEFQALRTCLDRVKASLSAAGDSGDTPAMFNVVPPAAGEQRITNPINFSAKYRMFGTSIYDGKSSSLLDNAEVSQAFDLETDMIDVLVYIRQSAGGMNDAYRITLKPIAALLKEAQRANQNSSNPTKDADENAGNKVGELLKRTTSIASASIKGCRVTLVPGGATRLTESPIIQFVMKNAKAGFAVIDVPVNSFQNSLAPARASLLGISGALLGDQNDARLAQSMFSHATIAGWINVDVSAHYHNRRLVAWEPLIEEWTADAKVGVDLVRVLSLAPSVRSDSALVANEKEMRSSSGNTGERLRDIKRLFGSPFATKQSEGETESFVKTPSDMPYLLLVSMAPSLISSALHHTQSRDLDFQHSSQRRAMRIPGLRRLEWLKQFGHPGFAAENAGVEPAIQCAFSDTKPLNINFTGALIENLATYLSGTTNTNAIIPHWIRNETGLTIRFVEVLDEERLGRGDRPKPVTLASGREIPLSLKRSVSQSCDPHRAQITLELGSFEETVDRVNHSNYKVSKGSRATTLFYRALGRIPVDTVGLHELSFYENTELLSQSTQKATSAAGKIIVRISLKGGIKLVSIESPMVLCNATDQDLYCEVRDRNGISLHWSSVVPRGRGFDGEETKPRASAPIPADLLSSIDDANSTLSLSSLSETHRLPDERESGPPTPVGTPLRYSRSSILKGIITESELSLMAYHNLSEESAETEAYAKFTYLSACSLRLGSFETAASSRQRINSRKPSEAIIPQQRMLLLRPPLVIANHLPVLMHVQVRTKTQGVRLGHASSVNLVALQNSENRSHAKELRGRQLQENEIWTDLGVISCGKSVCWTGAQASQEVEMKVRLMDVRDKSAEKFPSWSTIATVHAGNGSGSEGGGGSSSMKVVDQAGTPLTLSVHVDAGINDNGNEESSGVEDVRSFAAHVDQAPRVVCVTVPYWIVDSSAMELEFLSNRPVAGQSGTWSQSKRVPVMVSSQDDNPMSTLSCLGLSEIVGNEQLELDPTTAPFEILMIGDDLATRLSMRQTRTRMSRANNRMSQYTSAWCEPLPLHVKDSTFTDVDVFPPSGLTDADDPSSFSSDVLEPLALRSEIVKAPSKCGGSHGTRIVHLCNRYKIMNEMGRDLEISAGHGRGEPITIKATGYPVPFHFNDSSPIRFRPKEFGWLWSGKISVLKKRREVTLRLVHRLRGQVIIASMECLASSKSPSIVLVFRNASQPPFRLENHTMYAFRYGQSSQFVTDEENQNWQRSDLSLDSTLLPYQHADFAWDEPDEGRRSVSIELGDTAVRGRNSSTESRILGTLALEKIAPGSNLKLSSRDFSGQIVADGPTRVLRITDAHLPDTSSDRDIDGDAYVNAFSKNDGALNIPSRIEIRLFHGVGISVVDWSPQELLYISINDIVIDRNVDTTHEHFSIAAGHVSVDNQLWVTPYPVLLKAGRKQAAGRRRRNQAFELGWSRALAKQGGLMLLTNLDLSVDPITIRVDGAVVNDLVNMILHPIEAKVLNTPQGDQWLEAEIRNVLGLGDVSRQKAPRKQTLAGQLLDSGEEFLATAAMAAKINVGSRSHLSGASASRVEPHRESSRHRENKRKIYINRLKISTVKTEISWTGALPDFIGISGMLRPALTFESLPVLLRSFTSYHVYGTNQDIAEGLKHHYVSVWRVFDVLVGITFKPSFLIRACVYTTRESVASFLDTVSKWCSKAEITLLKYIPKDMISKSSPSSSSIMTPKRKGIESVPGLYRAMIGKPTLLMASSYRTWAVVLSSFASSLRYREPGSGLAVRTRNPRVFAHVDGKDLLVEHVEGENAGKALLSRVRAGQHLGEGYVYHTENVHVRSSRTDTNSSSQELSSTSLILMVTSERVLLVNGERKAKFCEVIWEALFSNMVFMEMADEGSNEGAFFRLIKIWYLVDTEQSKGNTDDRLSRLAHTMVGDADLGLGMLVCKSLFVPRDVSKTLRIKIASVHSGLEENGPPSTSSFAPSFSLPTSASFANLSSSTGNLTNGASSSSLRKTASSANLGNSASSPSLRQPVFA